MKILKFIVAFVIAITLSSCNSDKNLALDTDLQNKIGGVWINVDENLENSTFFAYEFKDNEILYHKLEQSKTTSYKVADFEISDGEIIITNENERFKNKIEITSEDTLILGDKDEEEIFRRVNENEIKEYYLP